MADVQAMRALNTANRLRLRRAREKAVTGSMPMRAGRAHVARLLEDPPEWLLGAEVGDVLRWPTRVDYALMRQALRCAALDTQQAVALETKPVGDLTPRQVRALAEWLRGGMHQ